MMTTADILAPLTDWVVSSNETLDDAARWIILLLAVVQIALLAALWRRHLVGRMPGTIAVGVSVIYVGVFWAQPRRISEPGNELIPLNVIILIGLALSVYGSLKVLSFNLFRRDD